MCQVLKVLPYPASDHFLFLSSAHLPSCCPLSLPPSVPPHTHSICHPPQLLITPSQASRCPKHSCTQFGYWFSFCLTLFSCPHKLAKSQCLTATHRAGGQGAAAQVKRYHLGRLIAHTFSPLRPLLLPPTLYTAVRRCLCLLPRNPVGSSGQVLSM